MKRTILQAPVTRTAPTNGAAVDISTLVDTSLTVAVEITAMTAGADARLVIQTSIDGFATFLESPVVSILGAVSNSAAIRVSWRTRDIPDFQSGVGGTSARLCLTRLTGSSPAVTFNSFIDIASA